MEVEKEKQVECTTNDLCKYLGVSRMSVERYRKAGMPYIKRGRGVFFILEDVQNWIAERNKTVKYNYKNTSAN